MNDILVVVGVPQPDFPASMEKWVTGTDMGTGTAEGSWRA
jgi:hypothetical protein